MTTMVFLDPAPFLGLREKGQIIYTIYTHHNIRPLNGPAGGQEEKILVHKTMQNPFTGCYAT